MSPDYTIKVIANPRKLFPGYITQVRQEHVLADGATESVWLVSAVILLSAPCVVKVLRRLGLMVCERLMGMILMMLSVQMLLDGISNYLK